MSEFDKCMKVVFGAEGGYSDHPADKGGKTNMGITAGTLSKAYTEKVVSHNEVKNLTRAEAEAIYKKYYWSPSKASEMAYPLCLLHFDAAVNHGVGGAGKLLQKTINSIKGNVVAVDGAVGAKTLSALKDIDTKSLCVELLKTRKEYFEAIVRNNPSQGVFLKGWLNRIEKLKKYI